MRIDIITLFPELLVGPFEVSIIKRALESGKASVHFHHLRDYAVNKQKQVDDYPFGGGAGMVLRIEPIDRCISALQKERKYDDVVYLTPDGIQLNQALANQYSLKENIILLCGHYKGVDQRVRDHLITQEISIGDFVLSGGELAAAVFCDSIIRLLPGVLGDESSALSDSFQDGLLAPPIFTRPANYKGWEVPEILTSGNSPKIEEWRENEALKRTQTRRPDLL
ncbi:MAG: tRNA (guanosine(37)-N1)-methyltransferase TrmD [Flavobacteriaceae bacterium]|jgi:tRNA (guanine37-N1)-methyltransferase